MNMVEALIFIGGMLVGAGVVIGLLGLIFMVWLWRSE